MEVEATRTRVECIEAERTRIELPQVSNLCLFSKEQKNFRGHAARTAVDPSTLNRRSPLLLPETSITMDVLMT